MKKLTLTVILVLMSAETLAQAVSLCGEVERFRVWASGSGNNNIWVEYKSNPSQCPGGFYMAHGAENKDHLFSLLLAAKATNEEVCIQTYPTTAGWTVDGRCKINYGMHK